MATRFRLPIRWIISTILLRETLPYVKSIHSIQLINRILSWRKPRSRELRTRNTELKGSPCKVWSRSVYCYACHAYCQGFLPCQFLLFRFIHLHFFQNLFQVFPVLAAANTGSCVGPQNKIGHLARCRFPCLVPAEYRFKTHVTCGVMTCEINNLETEWSFCSALM